MILHRLAMLAIAKQAIEQEHGIYQSRRYRCFMSRGNRHFDVEHKSRDMKKEIKALGDREERF